MSRRNILTPGGPGDVEGLYSLLLDHFKGILANHPDPRFRSVHDVSFSLNYDFIAAIEGDESDQYHIFLDATMPLQLIIVFRRLMAHPNVLQAIGMPPLHHEPQSLILLLESPKELTSGLRESPEISDERRIAAVNLLTTVASEFVVMHEVGHAVLGHLNLVNDLDRFLFPPKEVRRGLEHSADCFAIEVMLGYDYWRKIDSSFHKDIEPERFRLIGFAIGTVWHILAAVTLNRASSLRYYPKVGTRSWVVEKWVESHMVNRSTGVEQMRQVYNGIYESRVAWEEMAWPTPPLATDEETYLGLKDMEAALLALERTR